MHFSTILSGLLLVASAIAAPGNGKGSCHQKRGGGGKPLYRESLSDAEVDKLISGYTYLLVNPGGRDFNKTANAILTEDFQVFSDSILYLSGRPLNGAPAYPSRAGFIATQFMTPALPQLETVNYFYDCSDQKIGWRWRASGIGSNKYSISGLIDMDLKDGLIKTVYSEFNTAAFLFDLNVTSCVPQRRPSLDT